MSVRPERRVVIVGGGFAGIGSARLLEGSCQVTVVEQCSHYHIPIPSVRAIVDEEMAWKQFVPYDKSLKRGKVVQGTATGMLLNDPKEPKVLLADGSALAADAVVMAIGAKYAFPAKRSPAPLAERVAAYKACREAVAAAKTCVVVGGGVVGVEIAGEIASATKCKVTIVHSGPRVLVRSGGNADKATETQSAACAKQLAKLGVAVVLDDKVPAKNFPKNFKDLDGPIPIASGAVETASGATVSADIAFWCAGNAFDAKDVFDMLPCTARGKFKVDAYLRCEGHDRVFAAGEVAHVGDEEYDTAVIDPMVAVVAANVKKVLAGKKPSSKFALSKYRPKLVIVGPKFGATKLPIGVVFTGSGFLGNLKNSLGMFFFKVWPMIGRQKVPKHFQA